MKKISIQKSIEGGEYKTVILDEKLVKSLSDYNMATDTFVYLFLTKGIIKYNDEVYTKLVNIIDECEVVFREYSLDKYDVRAHYLFDESEIVEK